jgi:cytoskeletal protein RodZ
MRNTAMNPIFETKKINMETLPEFLKAARESLGYSEKQVAKITNISEKFIENLDAGYYHRLPADVYVYGFLRKLAELYRTDSELLIYQYKKERGIHEQLNKKAVPYKSYTDPKIEITPRTIGLGALVVFVVFILGYLAYQVHAINRPPRIAIDAPQDGARITSSSVVVQGHTDVGANLTMNDQQIFVDSEGNFKQPVSISPGEKVLLFISKNNFGKISTKQIVVIGDFQTQQLSSQPATAPLTLTIDVGPNSTWVTLQIDGKPVQNETFIAGSTKTYTAQSKIILSTGDGGSTSVKLNGKDLGKLGRDGEVVRDIPFTADSVNSK